MPAWALFLLFSVEALASSGCIAAASLTASRAARARLLLLALLVIAGSSLLVSRLATAAPDGQLMTVVTATLAAVAPAQVMAIVPARWRGRERPSWQAWVAMGLAWLGLAICFGARLACQLDASCDV